MKYKVKRTEEIKYKKRIHHKTETIFTGTISEVMDYITSVMERNSYEYSTTVSLEMLPVWRVTGNNYGEVNKIFYLEKIR